MFKKCFALFTACLMSFGPAFSYSAANSKSGVSMEHLKVYPKQNRKTDIVQVGKNANVVNKDNIVPIVFVENFNSKYYKVGDVVEFKFSQDVKTQEGTLVIPCNSTILAKIECLTKPKVFSRNARVGLKFYEVILPNGSVLPLCAVPNTKNGELKKGAGATIGKILGYTIAIGGVGTGLGAAIGVAGGNVISGVIIGGSIGGGVGLATGIVSPGLHYRAKKDQMLYVRLIETAAIPKMTPCP